jgi:hypothetical protein
MENIILKRSEPALNDNFIQIEGQFVWKCLAYSLHETVNNSAAQSGEQGTATLRYYLPLWPIGRLEVSLSHPTETNGQFSQLRSQRNTNGPYH